MRRGAGRAALGIAISVVALALVVRSVNIGAAWQALQHANPAWLALLLVFIVGDVALRSVRWRVLLGPIGKVSLRTTAGSLLVGYLANNVLPARLGEVVRSHHLGERTSLSRSTILGTIVVERVVDTAVVVVIASAAILVLSVRGVVASAVLVGLAVTAVLVVGIGVGMVAHRLPGADRAARFLGQWPRVHGALVRLRAGLSVTRDVPTMLVAVALSVGSWSLTVLAFASAAQAVGVQPTIGQAALLAAGTNLATAVPAAPGYVGTFELAAVTIATSVGIGADSALAFAVLVHAATLLLTSIGGAVVFMAGGRRRIVPEAGPAVEVGRVDEVEGLLDGVLELDGVLDPMPVGAEAEVAS